MKNEIWGSLKLGNFPECRHGKRLKYTGNAEYDKRVFPRDQYTMILATPTSFPALRALRIYSPRAGKLNST